MSVAVLENTAPIEAVARAITTPVTEFVMVAVRDEYGRDASRKLESLSFDTEEHLIEHTSNPVANAHAGPLQASGHDAHQFP